VTRWPGCETGRVPPPRSTHLHGPTTRPCRRRATASGRRGQTVCGAENTGSVCCLPTRDRRTSVSECVRRRPRRGRVPVAGQLRRRRAHSHRPPTRRRGTRVPGRLADGAVAGRVRRPRGGPRGRTAEAACGGRVRHLVQTRMREKFWSTLLQADSGAWRCRHGNDSNQALQAVGTSPLELTKSRHR